MEKRVVMMVAKRVLKKAVTWLKDKLWERLKVVFLRAFDSVKESLWSEVKMEVKACAQELVRDAESLLTSVEAAQKEKLIIDMIMSKLELPVLLRPFKGIIKKILKSRIEDTVKALLQKGKDIVS